MLWKKILKSSYCANVEDGKSVYISILSVYEKYNNLLHVY